MLTPKKASETAAWRGGAVLFDLDGTLADTAPDLIAAANDLMRESGWPAFDPAPLRATAGRGGRALIRHGLRAAGVDASDAAVDALFPRYLEVYGGRLTRESQVFPGVETALERLRAEGRPLGVCTNKPFGLAEKFLRETGLDGFFDVVLGADSLPVRKPDPAHVWETAARLGVDRRDAVLIGDTVTDRDAARNAGVPVVLVSFGYATESLETLAPDAVIHDFAELDGTLAALGR